MKLSLTITALILAGCAKPRVQVLTPQPTRLIADQDLSNDHAAVIMPLGTVMVPVVVCSRFDSLTSKYNALRLTIDNSGSQTPIDWPREHLESFCGQGLAIVPYQSSVGVVAAIDARRGFWGNAFDSLSSSAGPVLAAAGFGAGSDPVVWAGIGISAVNGIKNLLIKQQVSLIQSVDQICPSGNLRVAAGAGATCFLLEVK